MTTPDLLSDLGATPPAARAAEASSFLLWDLPLRVFHWALVAAVTTAVVTGERGGAWMPWHGRAGLVIVGLLVFRLAWGIVGSATARFTHFAPTPAALLAYVRGRWRGVGHNPLGALAVFALLGVLAAQAATGLFGNDDIAFAGPLNHLVGDDTGDRLTGWHRLLADGLFALLALHLAAIAFHVVVKRHRLVRPMITGRQRAVPGAPRPPRVVPGRYGLIGAVALAAAVVLAISGADRAPLQAPSPAATRVVAERVAAPASAAAPAW